MDQCTEPNPPGKAILVAEIGINHNGDRDLAESMIIAAKRAGADAVKFQNYKTEDFLTDGTLRYRYISQGMEVEESQFDMFKRCELDDDALKHLKCFCDQNGIIFFSTPTNESGVDILRDLGVPYLKNGSDFLGHLPLIRYMARTGIPTILSTGMATEGEIAEACESYLTAHGRNLMLLVCTSSYPTPPANVHLRRIPELRRRFGVPVGFSDHTAGWEAAVAAVCLGACLIEKHFTTDQSMPGPDQWFSSNPSDFSELVLRVRNAELLLGSSKVEPTPVEHQARAEYRLSCVAARDLIPGVILAESDIRFRRPATGIPPSRIQELLGKQLVMTIGRGEPFQAHHVRC